MNKLIGIILAVISWALIAWMTTNGFGNMIAGYVLTFACGMLAGYIGRQ